jgi:hypothetical protein
LVIELLSIGSVDARAGALLLRSGAARMLNVCNPERLASGAIVVRTLTPPVEHAAAVNTNALVMVVSRIFERIHPPEKLNR